MTEYYIASILVSLKSANTCQISNEKVKTRCDVCHKSFSKDVLEKHREKHLGFKCDICENYFYRKCSLKIHMRNHKGLKSYYCEKCNKYFHQSSNFKTHVCYVGYIQIMSESD